MRTRVLLSALVSVAPTLASALLAGPLTPARPADAAFQVGDARPQVLVGRDDDYFANRLIDADAGANQNLRNADILIGGAGNDVLIGRFGNDLLRGGHGDDILRRPRPGRVRLVGVPGSFPDDHKPLALPSATGD